ncbi:MAG: hypothetical protein KF810_16830 [Rhizobiaceae bacterium]|nr:hypothetical protein [Rhizobiaceae bacterium]
MAISIRTPQAPQGVDYSGLFGGLDQLGQNIQGRRAFDAYNEWLQGVAPQAAPQQPTLSNLAPIDQAQPMDYASQRVSQAHAASGGNPPQGAIESYIRHAAQKRGIDPDTAIKVAMSEGGLEDPVRQSDVVKNGVREQSYGPFQLYMGGGLGNEFQQATGMHPGDRNAWQKAIDFALDKAKENGWGAWYGAAKAGIGDRDGIGTAQGAVNAMAGGSAPQMVQADPQATGGSVLPPPEVMQKLFRSEQTRPLAIQLAQTAQAARGGDPEAALKLRKLQAEVQALENPQEKPTDDMREYAAARAQGFQGSLQDWIVGNRRAGATNVNVNSGEKSWDQESAKLFAKRYDDITAGAGNAQQMLGMYDLAEQALNSGVRTGFGAETELNLRQLGAAMGIDTDPEKLAGGELIRSIQNRMALTMRSPDGGMGMPGALSDRDIKFLKDSQIGIDRSPEGNRRMLAAYRKVEQRKVEIAALADQYVQENGRLDAGFNQMVREWAARTPLFSEEDLASPTGLPAGVTEDDIIETMRANNMTREEVMKRLMGGQ